ncbi:MAG: DUF6585 family protein [Chloroflexota bacterium]
MADFAAQAQMGSDTYSLGAPTAEYKPGRGAILRAFLGFILAVVGVFGLLYAAIGSHVSTTDRRPILILAGFGVLMGWVLIESWIGRRNLRVQVFTDGLVRSQHGKTVVVRWDEIASVLQSVTKHYTNGIYTGTTHTYTVFTKDGTKTTFNDTLKNVEQLGNAIQDQVAKRLYPQMMTLYNNGGTVQFGKLSISPMGLAWGDKSLAWSEIEAVQIQKGILSVKKQEKWFKWANIPVSSIPNMLVALTMIDRIVGLKTKK